MEAKCNTFINIINNRYPWYVELVYVYKSFAHPEIEERCRLIKVFLTKQKNPNHLNLFSEYVRCSYFLIKFLLNYQCNKWLINFFCSILKLFSLFIILNQPEVRICYSFLAIDFLIVTPRSRFCVKREFGRPGILVVRALIHIMFFFNFLQILVELKLHVINATAVVNFSTTLLQPQPWFSRIP